MVQSGAAADKAAAEAADSAAAVREEARRRQAAERKAAEAGEALKALKQVGLEARGPTNHRGCQLPAEGRADGGTMCKRWLRYRKRMYAPRVTMLSA